MFVEKALDDSWAAWLQENLERRCDPGELVGILVKNGFSLGAIRERMGERFPNEIDLGRAVKDAPAPIDHLKVASVRITRPDSGIHVQWVLTRKLQIYTVENFLSAEESDQIVEIANSSLRPSTVTTNTSGYRTSTTCDLSLLHRPEVDVLDEKIARALGIRLPYSEGIQAQRYDVGQEFKQHTDYFQPGTGEYSAHASEAGQRTWTFMVYLNDVEKGGGTRFYALDRTFMPRKGMAVVWNNLFPDGTVNPNTLHSGLPVEAGQKVIITKWFRERGPGPMFYED